LHPGAVGWQLTRWYFTKAPLPNGFAVQLTGSCPGVALTVAAPTAVTPPISSAEAANAARTRLWLM
jgi:hypothetical protein